MKNRLLLSLIFLTQWAHSANLSENNLGLNIFASGDIVAKFGDAGPGPKDRLTPREAEIALYSPADHVFDGMLSAAAHWESGAVNFEIHELYASSSKLIPRSQIKIGQFFLGVGILNQVHRHDWPFISAPKVHSDFFDDEAAIDSGLEYSWLLPFGFYLNLTAGITSGWTFGHSHSAGVSPNIPTHYLRLTAFSAFSSKDGVQYSINYLGRKDSNRESLSMIGLDLKAKWKELKTLKFLLQSEIWYRILSGATTERKLGFYLLPQYGFNENLSLGLRLDGVTNLSLQDISGNSISNWTFAFVPTLTYRVSEFTTFKFAYTLEPTLTSGQSASTDHAVELQTVFIIGAHPAHEF